MTAAGEGPVHQDDPVWAHAHGDGSVTTVVMTDRRHGDLAVSSDPAAVDARRRAIVDAPWVWLRQVHGADVVVADAAGRGAGGAGDAVVTTALDAPIAVTVADCAPVVFIADGVIGVAHAGWRGLVAGVIEATVSTMRDQGATDIVAVLGACIRPQAYEFGAADLDRVVDRFGPGVRATTATGTPALDVPATVRAALDETGVALAAVLGACTASEAELRWSHRARGDRARQAMVAWRAMP